MTTFAAAFMTVSIIAVTCLAGWCFFRIMKAPPPGQE